MPAIKLAAGKDARPPEMKELLRTKSNRISHSRQLYPMLIGAQDVLVDEYFKNVAT